MKIEEEIISYYDITAEEIEELKEIEKMNLEAILKIFKALSDPIRLKIIRLLGKRKLCVCVIVEILNHKYSKISYHLKKLYEADLVKSEKKRQFLIYKLTDKGQKTLDLIKKLEKKH